MTEPKFTPGRGERQAQVNRRVAELRARAVGKLAAAAKTHDAIMQDSAFWTQPAYNNAAGRAFARRRERERAKLYSAAHLAGEAEQLSAQANRLEARGAVMAGDAKRARDEVIAACSVKIGDLIDTTLYGVRRVVKVNRKTVAVEGALAPITICKSFVTLAKGGPDEVGH